VALWINDVIATRDFCRGEARVSCLGGGLEPEAWRAWHGGHGMVEPPVGSRAEPLVGGSGGRSPAEAENLLASGCATEAAEFASFCPNFNLK